MAFSLQGGFAVKMCQHCGYDLELDAVIELGDFVLRPDGHCSYREKEIPLTAQQGRLLHTLAKGRPRYLSLTMIGERLSDCENPYRLTSVILCHVTNRFKKHGLPLPIKKKHGVGLAWDDEKQFGHQQ